MYTEYTEFISKILSILQNFTKLLCLGKTQRDYGIYWYQNNILKQKDYGPKLSSLSEQKMF